MFGNVLSVPLDSRSRKLAGEFRCRLTVEELEKRHTISEGFILLGTVAAGSILAEAGLGNDLSQLSVIASASEESKAPSAWFLTDSTSLDSLETEVYSAAPIIIEEEDSEGSDGFEFFAGSNSDRNRDSIDQLLGSVDFNDRLAFEPAAADFVEELFPDPVGYGSRGNGFGGTDGFAPGGTPSSGGGIIITASGSHAPELPANFESYVSPVAASGVAGFEDLINNVNNAPPGPSGPVICARLPDIIHTENRPPDDNPECPLTVQFSSDAYSVNEASGTATIEVTLSYSSFTTVTVDYATSDGTAAADNDYTAASGTLTFDPGQTSNTFAVSINNDPLEEEDETVNLTLSNPTNVELADPFQASLTIRENDPPPTVQFIAPNYFATEGESEPIMVYLSWASEQTVTVNYDTGDGSAKADSDYVAASGTLTFDPGQTSKTFDVLITEDRRHESTEFLLLLLSSPTNASMGTPSRAILMIGDDDPPPAVSFDRSSYWFDETAGTATIDVKLSSMTDDVVTVQYATSDGTAKAGSDYTPVAGTVTINPGSQFGTIQVPIINDLRDELEETLNLTLTNPVNAALEEPSTALLTIRDDEQTFVRFIDVAEGSGPYYTATVALSMASDLEISVNYASSDNTATAGEDYVPVGGTFTFAPGEVAKQFYVYLIDDNVDEYNYESLYLTLSEPVNAFPGDPWQIEIFLIEEDPTPTVQFSSATYETEEHGDLVVTVTLSNPSEKNPSVRVKSEDGTATNGTDYAFDFCFLEFYDHAVSRTCNIDIRLDTMDEFDEFFFLRLTQPNDLDLGHPAVADVTIFDDDLPPAIQFLQESYTAIESTFTELAQITVRLSEPSGKPITVNYATSEGTATPGADYGPEPGTVLIPPDSYYGTFAVPIVDDTLWEGEETVYLSLSDPTNATLGEPDEATLTIVDNEEPPPRTVHFDTSYYVAYESAEEVTFNVILSYGSGEETVTVEYQTMLVGSATAAADYVPVRGTLTFESGEFYKTFTVLLIDDPLGESDETVGLQLFNPSGAFLGVPSIATLTIYDDDDANALPTVIPIVQFSETEFWAIENDEEATITVTLSGAYDQAVTVDYSTADGTADSTNDYTATSGSLTFAPGELSQSFTVPLTDDEIEENDEAFLVRLSPTSSAVLLGSSVATVSVYDDQGYIADAVLDLDVNGDGDLNDAGIDGVANYLPGYEGDTAMLSNFGDEWRTALYRGQLMKIVLDGVGTSNSDVRFVEFRITEVSSHPGYAENKTDYYVRGPHREQDYSFLFTADLPTIYVTRDAIPGKEIVAEGAGDFGGMMEDHKTWTYFYAKDYGGKAKVKVTAYGEGMKTLFTKTLTIPLDDDNDSLADKWETARIPEWNQQYCIGVATDDIYYFNPWEDLEYKDPDGSSSCNGDGGVDQVAQKTAGDSLTVLQEYRGFILDGGGFDWDGANPHEGGHVRLSPAYKELLVEVDVMAGVPHMPSLDDIEGEVLTRASQGFSNKGCDCEVGAGIRMYWVISEPEAGPHRVFTSDLFDPPAWAKPHRNQANLSEFVHLMFAHSSEPGTLGISGGYGSYVFIESEFNRSQENRADDLPYDMVPTLRMTTVHELTHLLIYLEPGTFTIPDEHVNDDEKYLMHTTKSKFNRDIVLFDNLTLSRLDLRNKESVER